MVAWITFTNLKPLNHLLTYGLVYTIRRFNRVTGKVKLKYNGRTIGLVRVEFVGFVKYEDGRYIVVKSNKIEPLENYVSDSGFSSVSEWVDAYLSIFKRKPNNSRLYLVVLIRKFYSDLIDVV